MSTFGRDFRRELFARTASLAATRLGFVLVDETYAQRVAAVVASYRYLRAETCLHGQDLDRGRDELTALGLLVVHSEGKGVKARTRWTLVLPETSGVARTFEPDEESQNARPSPDVDVRSNDRLNVRSNDRLNVRSTPDTVPDPGPDPHCAGCAGAVDDDGWCDTCQLVTRRGAR